MSVNATLSLSAVFECGLTFRTVSAVALHGVYRAVMGWPTPFGNPW